MSEPAHILVVDDDQRLRELLRRYLTRHGYAVTLAADAQEAAARLESFLFDLLVLDLMLPGEDGLALARRLRATSDLPILVLTARSEVEDRIRGLEAGADDYLVKPFEPRELLLRIATILRRTARPAPRAEIRFGPYRFDLRTHMLWLGEQPVRLTTTEAAMLALLARRSGRAVSRAELAHAAAVDGSDRAVDVHIARLRRKLECDPRTPRYLLTHRGEGYALRTEDL